MQTQIEQFIDWKATHTKKAPITYKYVLNQFGRYFIKKDINSIEKLSLSNYREWYLYAEQRHSANGLAYNIQIIKMFLDFWRPRMELKIYSNDIRVPKFISTKRKVVSREDYELMKDYFKDNTFTEIRNRLIVRILWETGMRVSELCDLQIKDINIQEAYATITTKKNRQTRWIAWSEETNDLLKRYFGVRLCLNQKEDVFITLHEGRNKISTRQVERIINGMCTDLGITRYTPHSYRHGKAHEMLRLSANIKEVQQQLGHSERNPMASFLYLRLDHVEGLRIAKKFV